MAEDSKRVHDEMVRHNAQSRRRFRQEENEKFRVSSLSKISFPVVIIGFFFLNLDPRKVSNSYGKSLGRKVQG